MEACVGAHHLSRKLQSFGHDARLMPANVFRRHQPRILSTRSDVLSPRMVRIIEELADDWHRLDQRVATLSTDIKALADQDPACERLMTVPGIGPIISSAMVAAIGNGAAFSKGRDFGAWLGLVPRQMSTGDRTILGKISKQGNRYLRVLFVQAAWVVLVKPTTWERHGLKPWIEAAKKRLHPNVLAIALANNSLASHGRSSTRNTNSNAPGRIRWRPELLKAWHRARGRQGVAWKRQRPGRAKRDGQP
jgi:transposase